MLTPCLLNSEAVEPWYGNKPTYNSDLDLIISHSDFAMIVEPRIVCFSLCTRLCLCSPPPSPNEMDGRTISSRRSLATRIEWFDSYMTWRAHQIWVQNISTIHRRLCAVCEWIVNKGRFRLCPSREEKRHYFGPNYVERRSLWAEKYIKIIQCQILNILRKKKFGLSTEVWVEHFARPKLCSRGRTLGATTS